MSRHLVIRLFVVGICPLFLSACATIMRGPKEVLIIQSDPPGATVTVAGHTATTPARIELPRKFQGPITIAKDGYVTTTVDVSSHLASAGGANMAGNALLGFGGIVCASIDVASGATNELRPNPVEVHLVPLAHAAAMADAAPVVAPE